MNEEFTIRFRWIRNGKPGEDFVNMLQVKALDAATVTDTLCYSCAQASWVNVIGLVSVNIYIKQKNYLLVNEIRRCRDG